jgi:hypothetical protein
MLLSRPTWILRLAGLLKAVGPYAAIELILPGGTLIALAIWLVKNRRKAAKASGGSLRAQVSGSRNSSFKEPGTILSR